jgi:hypothetical protein
MMKSGVVYTGEQISVDVTLAGGEGEGEEKVCKKQRRDKTEIEVKGG